MYLLDKTHLYHVALIASSNNGVISIFMTWTQLHPRRRQNNISYIRIKSTTGNILKCLLTIYSKPLKGICLTSYQRNVSSVLTGTCRKYHVRPTPIIHPYVTFLVIICFLETPLLKAAKEGSRNGKPFSWLHNSTKSCLKGQNMYLVIFFLRIAKLSLDLLQSVSNSKIYLNTMPFGIPMIWRGPTSHPEGYSIKQKQKNNFLDHTNSWSSCLTLIIIQFQSLLMLMI